MVFFTVPSKKSVKIGYYMCSIMEQSVILDALVDYAETYEKPSRRSTMKKYFLKKYDRVFFDRTFQVLAFKIICKKAPS